MARFVSSRQGCGARAPVQERIAAEPASPEPAVEAVPPDTSCFDSSWDLRQGLEVAELDALPEELLLAPTAPPRAPADRS